MWLLFALAGPIFWAASTHIDKYLVDKYFQDASTAVLIVFTSLINILLLPVIWYFIPGIFTLPLASIAVMIASGFLFMAAIMFYLKVIQTEEVSVVVPLFQISVLWSALLAYIFLHETLTQIQLLGIGLILAAVFVLSANLSKGMQKVKLRLFLTMLACTFALALSTVVFKIFAVDGEFWATTFWTYVGSTIFGFAIFLRPGSWQQFKALFRKHPGPMIGVNAANELINLGGSLGARYALTLAPVSFVQAVGSTTPLFVFFFGILITLFFPKLEMEDLSGKNILRKGIAAALVVAGIILVELSK